MLPKKYRLTKKVDFEAVLKCGRWFRAPHLSLKVLKTPEEIVDENFKNKSNKLKKPFKIAVSAGLKFSKKAVIRNKVRRQIFEAVRMLMKDKKIACGYFLLFVPDPQGGHIKAAQKKFISTEKGKNQKNKVDNDNYDKQIFANLSEEVKLLLNKSGLTNDKN